MNILLLNNLHAHLNTAKTNNNHSNKVNKYFCFSPYRYIYTHIHSSFHLRLKYIGSKHNINTKIHIHIYKNLNYYQNKNNLQLTFFLFNPQYYYLYIFILFNYKFIFIIIT